VLYDVILNLNGTNVTIATGMSGTSMLYNVTQQVTNGKVYVLTYDGVAGPLVAQNAVPFQMDLSPQFGALSCADTLPNELDMPGQAQMPVNVSVVAPLGFSNASGILSLQKGLDESTSWNCTVVQTNVTNGKFVCFVPMRYFFGAGMYDLNATFTTSPGYELEIFSAGACEYLELLASQRTTAVVSFPTAAPGIANASGNVPVVMRNTANGPFQLYLTAYDLTGRTTPSMKLAASTFRAGKNLSTSVQLVNGTMKNVSILVAPAENAQGNVSLWVSMPVGQALQEYYTTTPWVLTASS
jgi:hypothetical protein